MNPENTDYIFNIKSADDFPEYALEIFRRQFYGNIVYGEFIRNLRKDPVSVKSITDIPFLPVEFFKNHKVVTGTGDHVKIFESSGTTGNIPSSHYIVDIRLYEKSFLNSFMRFYGEPGDYMIAALLPSYFERDNSSLVYMMNDLINRSHYGGSGFYKDDKSSLLESIGRARSNGKKILLMGVSFALLDLAEEFSPDLHDTIVMETGGMKGRRKEITRPELHTILKNSFKVETIHSEYGMTELLSQAYSKGDGLFHSPPWMKMLIRDPQDPLSVTDEPGITGGLNIIDLANINSCAFIATGDLGRLHEDGSFEVLGRIDNSDIRGCNLLIV
jgi:phenylacetate-coenzyme A ligase PaaK-like adenylate-forming protein